MIASNVFISLDMFSRSFFRTQNFGGETDWAKNWRGETCSEGERRLTFRSFMSVCAKSSYLF